MPGRIVLQDVLLECQSCGGGAEPIPGKYTFEMSVFPMLASASLTRQQARRFLKKAEKSKSLESLEQVSETINPALAQAVSLAKADSNPFSSIKKLCRMVAFLGSISVRTLGGIGSAAGGMYALDEAWKRYNTWSESSTIDQGPKSQAHPNLPDTNASPKRKPDLKPSSAKSREQKGY
ncbi:hypothetical protein [Paracoccus hibiscisoli]|nr:hypothetical protein [Paracoccus hibiscisoli]